MVAKMVSKQRSRPRLLRRFGEELRRLRHFRGHGVHSPYIYAIVRDVFMSRTIAQKGVSELFSQLLTLPIDRREVTELHNLYLHCGVAGYAIDPEALSGEQFVLYTADALHDQIRRGVGEARESGAIVVVLRGKRSVAQDLLFDELVTRHGSTTVDRRAYLLIFNNHLPKQHFVL